MQEVQRANALNLHVGGAAMKLSNSKIKLPTSTGERRTEVFGAYLPKRLLTTLAFLAFVACGTGAARAAALVNRLLDATSVSSQVLATPTNWVVDAFRTVSGPANDGASSEGFANVQAPGGMGLFFKAFQGTTDNPITVNFYQDTAGTPGDLYTLTAFAGAEANYSGLIPGSPTKSQLALDFLDAANAVISRSVLDLKGAGLGTPNGSPFGYAEYSVMGTAPAGTVTVRARASMIDGFNNVAGGGQAFVMDAFDLKSVPEPTAFIFVGLGLLGLIGTRRRS
jgi:hypothetical protein